MVILFVIVILAGTAFLIMKGRRERKNETVTGANWDPLAYTKAVYKEFEALVKDLPQDYQGIISDITIDIKPAAKLFSASTNGFTQTEMLMLEEQYKERILNQQKPVRDVAFYAITLAIARHYIKMDSAIAPAPSYLARVYELCCLCISNLERNGFYPAAEAAEHRAWFRGQFQEKYGITLQ